MHGVTDISGVEFGVDPDETIVSPDSLLKKILRGAEPEIIVFLSLGNRPVAGTPANLDTYGDIATLAFGEESDELAGASSDEVLLLSDGDWIGRPDDFGAAHLESDPRIVSAGDYQERCPLLPEEGRRAASLIASVEAANDDGYWSDWQYDRTVEGQPAKLFIGEDGGLSRDFLNLAVARGKSVRAGVEHARIDLGTVADLLEHSPFCREKFEGKGGATGDAHLAGKRIQIVVGYCPNVELILESAATETWRISAGEVNAVLKLKDALAPLTFHADYPDYAALQAATIPPGFYATALAIGRARTNRGGLALGRVTADVEGSTLFGTYSAKTSDILVWAARGPAALPPEFLNDASYTVIPADPVGFVAFGDESVADIYNALLRPFNGWYGPDQFGRLGIDVINAERLAVPNIAIEEDDLFEAQPEEFEEAPRWAQSVSWGRNWTLMSADEIVDWTQNPNVTAEDAAFAQRVEAFARAEDTSVLQRFRLGGVFDGDEVYGPVAGYFTTEAGARAAAEKLLAWLKLRKKRIRMRSHFNLLFARAGNAGRVAFDGIGLAGGRDFLIQERTILTSDRQIEVNAVIAY